MTIITCQKCGKTYAYEVWGTVYPGGKERETADCPYCGETGYSEMTSQCISVYKVDEDGNVIRK
jgi:hypothetical protein